jgi:hypothetical protein
MRDEAKPDELSLKYTNIYLNRKDISEIIETYSINIDQLSYEQYKKIKELAQSLAVNEFDFLLKEMIDERSPAKLKLYEHLNLIPEKTYEVSELIEDKIYKYSDDFHYPDFSFDFWKHNPDIVKDDHKKAWHLLLCQHFIAYMCEDWLRLPEEWIVAFYELFTSAKAHYIVAHSIADLEIAFETASQETFHCIIKMLNSCSKFTKNKM